MSIWLGNKNVLYVIATFTYMNGIKIFNYHHFFVRHVRNSGERDGILISKCPMLVILCVTR